MNSPGTREEEKKKQKEMAESIITTLSDISQSLKDKGSASDENLKMIADELSQKAAEYISEKANGKSKISQEELKSMLDSVMKEAMEKAGKKPTPKK